MLKKLDGSKVNFVAICSSNQCNTLAKTEGRLRREHKRRASRERGGQQVRTGVLRQGRAYVGEGRDTREYPQRHIADCRNQR
jgi:hypothetical protein